MGQPQFDNGPIRHSVIFIKWTDGNEGDDTRPAYVMEAGLFSQVNKPGKFGNYRLTCISKFAHQETPNYVFAVMRQKLSNLGKKWLRAEGVNIP
jgi:hypothetical protein